MAAELFTSSITSRRFPALRGLTADDVDVMGFDDIEEGRFSIPAFATVDPGVEATAATILDLLAAPEALPGGHREVPFRLMRCEGVAATR